MKSFLTLPCLSVRDPWARAIFYLGKDVENRNWATRYRGDLLIHVALRVDSAPQVARRVEEHEPYPGCIIGVVQLEEIVLRSRSKWAEDGMMHWVLLNPRPFDVPVPYKGRLGLFQVAKRLLPRR